MITRVQGGQIVYGGPPRASDLWIEDERILSVGEGPATCDRLIAAEGCYVFPGGIDPHVHLGFVVGEFASTDTFESGSMAAAFGGVTTLIDFAVPEEGENTAEAARRRIAEGLGHCHVDFGIHAVVNRVHDHLQAEMRECLEMGVPDFKAFTTYEGLRLSWEDLGRLLSLTAEVEGLVLVHAEDDAAIASLVEKLVAEGQLDPSSHYLSRTATVEAQAVRETLSRQEATSCPLHFVHISAGESAHLIREAKRQGRSVSAETCPHYLFRTHDVYQGSEAALYMVSPPVKTAEDQQALWESLESRDLGMIATDHCPFSRSQKSRYDDFRLIPTGLPGVETTLPMMYSAWQTRGWPLQTLTECLSTNAARRFGLFPTKGALLAGSDADLVIYDPSASRTLTVEGLHMNVDWSPFIGETIQGAIRHVLLRGSPLILDGTWKGAEAGGRFIRRAPLSSPTNTNRPSETR